MGRTELSAFQRPRAFESIVDLVQIAVVEILEHGARLDEAGLDRFGEMAVDGTEPKAATLGNRLRIEPLKVQCQRFI